MLVGIVHWLPAPVCVCALQGKVPQVELQEKKTDVMHACNKLVEWYKSLLLCPGRTSGKLQMNRLSLRINQLKLETSKELSIILEESIEYTSNE